MFIRRQLITREDWDRALGEDVIRLHGVFRELNPDLAQILQNSRVVVVGEPGIGKTVLARRAMIEFAAQGIIPVYVPLSSYKGDLAGTLASASSGVTQIDEIEGDRVRRAYVLDGVDEIPADQLQQFLADLEILLARDPDAPYVLTCRQAVWEPLRSAFPPSFREYFPLGFSEDDILAYAEKSGLDPDAFAAELQRADLWTEAAIPFVLSTLADVFKDRGQLGRTRSDNMDVLTEDLLSKRTRFRIGTQRNALEVLGLAMELYSRNELSFDDAARLLSTRLTISTGQAEQLLDELTQTLLLRTAAGVRFQVRSFGEYFAARHLQNAAVAQVLVYCRFRGTQMLNPSWGNTISYLVELSPRVRDYFVRRHPEWVLSSSAAAFSDEQRADVVKRIIDDLAQKREYLLGHVSLGHHGLARLLTAADAAWLREHVNETESPAKCANALVLLGHLLDAEVLETAMRVAFDPSAVPQLRRAALATIALTGSPDVVPRLLAAMDADSRNADVLDVVGGFLTPENLPDVLPALARTDTHLTHASMHIRALRTREMLQAALDYFIANPGQACDSQIKGYVKPIWALASRFRDQAILEKIGRLLAALERDRVWEQQASLVSDLLKAVNDNGGDPEGIIARTVLQELIRAGLPLRHCWFTIARLCTPETASWLVEQNADPDLLIQVASASNDAVRAVLRSRLGDFIERQDAARAEMEREQRERERTERASGDADLETIRTSDDQNRVFAAFYRLRPSGWPQLAGEREEWLAAAVSNALDEANPLQTVRWISDNRLEYPRVLPIAVALCSHYGLQPNNDVLMVHALLAIPSQDVLEYHRKRPLSDKAIRELERLLADDMVPLGALDHFLTFVESSGLDSASIQDSLLRIIRSDRPMQYRYSPARILVRCSVADDVLVALRGEVRGTAVERIVLDALTDRKHLPTMFDRLGRLLKWEDAEFVAAERPFPNETELQWLTEIRASRCWNLLTELRRRVLRLQLPNLAGVVESTLAAIDKNQLIALIDEQMQDTPEDWREYTRNRAARYERELQFERAQAITLDEVIQRLAEDTIAYRVKLLCEGPTDRPIFETLLNHMGLADVVVPHAVNGWNNVLNPSFDLAAYIDGFQYAVMVLDGDCGRDLSVPDRPIKPEVEGLLRTLRERAGVPVHVLMRYGIENYFTQTAMEAVIGCDLSSAFPLDETRPLGAQIGGYNKNFGTLEK